MHEPLLSRAAAPTKTVVLGLLMRPYSLGHELFLLREDNPMATCASAEVPTGQQVALAALICSQTWEDNLAMPCGDWLLPAKLAIWRWRTRKADRIAEAHAFIRYRSEGCLEFPLAEVANAKRTSGSRAPGAPFLLRLQQFLMTVCRLPEAEAWDYPVGLAKMRWTTHWENEGGLEVYNHQDAEFDVFVAEQEAKGEQLCQA